MGVRKILDTAACQQGKNRETHLNIGHAESLSGKPAIFQRVRFNKARVGFELGIEIGFCALTFSPACVFQTALGGFTESC